MRDDPTFLTPRRILTSIGILFSGTTAARILSLASVVIVIRTVGPEEFGLYAASLALTKLTSVIFSLGLDDWLLRGGNLKNRGIKIAELLSSSLSIQFIVGLLWLGSLGILSQFLDPTVYPLDILLISGITVWLEELTQTMWTAFKVTLNNKVTMQLMILVQTLILGSALVCMAIGATTVLPYAIGRAIGTALGVIIAFIFILRQFGFQLEYRLSVRSLRETLPYAVSMALVLLYERADVTIIAWNLGKEAVGFYTPAVSLTLALAMAPAAIYGVILPVASRIFVERPTDLPSFSRQVLSGNLLLSITLGIGLALVARPVALLFYGPDYTATGDVLFVLSAVLAFRTLSFGLAAFVVAVGLQRQRIWAQAVAALFNIAGNLLTIRSHGIVGVAVVYCLSEAVLMLGYSMIFIRWLRAARNRQVTSR